MSILPAQTSFFKPENQAFRPLPLDGQDIARTICHAGALIAALIQPTADLMDRRPQLPPITTHFAEYFPNHKSHNAPVTPPDDSYFTNRLPKRKRSDVEPARETSPQALEPTPASLHLGDSAHSSAAAGEPERKRLRPYLARDSFQPRGAAIETGESEYKRPRSLTSPRHYVATEDRPSQRAPNDSLPRDERTSYERTDRTDWLTNVRDIRGPESKALPPLARPVSPPPRRASDDRWKGPWRSGTETHPTPVEPKASYFQVPPEEKPDPVFADRASTSEQNRIPPFTNVSSAASVAHSQSSDARYSSSSSRHITMNPMKSPRAASPRPRPQVGRQTTPPLRSARMPHDGPTGFPNSASDSSPVSGSRQIASPPRYTWDAPGLYEHPHRKRRGNLPKESTALLTDWFNQHSSYPYPKEAEKQALQAQTGLAMSQISNWFVNARRRRRPNATDRNEQIHHHHHHHHHQARPSSSHGREPLHTAPYR